MHAKGRMETHRTVGRMEEEEWRRRRRRRRRRKEEEEEEEQEHCPSGAKTCPLDIVGGERGMQEKKGRTHRLARSKKGTSAQNVDDAHTQNCFFKKKALAERLVSSSQKG
jgi:hypothetical protein